MGKIWQEIHCTKSGGGCGGFVLVKLNVSLNMRAEVVCPKCKHKHIRNIIDGEVHENGRFDNKVTEEICPTIAAWSEKPRTLHLEQWAGKDHRKERDGAVIKSEDDLVATEREDSKQGRSFLAMSWIEKFAGRSTGG